MNRHAGIFLAMALMLPTTLAFASGGGSGATGDFPGYMEIDPALVVNLSNPSKARYLRVDIQLFIESKEEADLVAHHMPRLRDRLISLLAGRDGSTLTTTEARDALRGELLSDLRETMTAQAGRPAISAIYFTGFIMQ
ncbi:flagellar basal body-associated FliL family protein [Thiocystis violacea]|uniref:flagellar basal body-associated FliL family protein n=1 Tax=Thiocystis violacea TaxID=13725 RepID=UPI001F5B18C2|nr:flagellar basal body-associated FliL family protein [Thiocystis violacea]